MAKIVQLADSDGNIYTEQGRNIAGLKLDSADVISVTPTAGTNYSSYGNTYYYKIGTRVHVHIGISGMTTSPVTVFTLPSGYRPRTITFGIGTGGTSSTFATININTAGAVRTSSTGSYCGADIEFDTF